MRDDPDDDVDKDGERGRKREAERAGTSLPHNDSPASCPAERLTTLPSHGLDEPELWPPRSASDDAGERAVGHISLFLCVSFGVCSEPGDISWGISVGEDFVGILGVCDDDTDELARGSSGSGWKILAS